MFRNREYRTGMKWCIWRWKDIDSDYLTRLHVIQTPWGSICLHWIQRADAERHLHDHPVYFVALILYGWYTEERKTTYITQHSVWFREGIFTRRWFNFIAASAADTHRIIACHPHTLTLCFMGPNRREWGFHTPEGWVSWKDYDTAASSRIT